MDLRLGGRAVLVTGGSSGIGKATVRLLLEEGAAVVTCARDVAMLERELAPIEREHPGRLLWRAADVMDPGALAELVEAGKARFGRLDGLVNNAGASRLSSFETTTDQAWRDELELKLLGAMRPLRAVQALLSASDAPAVVNVNAVLARQPEPHLVATSAARAALLNLTKSLSRELATSGTRVNSVLVGLIDSGQWHRRYLEQAPEDSYEAWCAGIAADRGIAAGRLGTPDEVAYAITMLLSPLAAYITGATVEVAGGVARYV